MIQTSDLWERLSAARLIRSNDCLSQEKKKSFEYLSRRVLSSLSLSIRISFCRASCWLSASLSSLRRAFSSVPCWASLRASSSSYRSVFFSKSPRRRPTSWVWSAEPGVAEGPACFSWRVERWGWVSNKYLYSCSASISQVRQSWSFWFWVLTTSLHYAKGQFQHTSSDEWWMAIAVELVSVRYKRKQLFSQTMTM